MLFIRTLLTALLLAACGAASAITYVDRSGTITAGTVSQTLAAANPTRGRIAITNFPTETEVLCVNVTSAASCTTPGSWVLAPGETIVIDSNELITVVATTTGHKYTAKENITDGFAINVSGSTSISGGAGDASAANQVTGNASLASIDGKLVGGAGAVGATVLRTTQASDSPLVATLGATADAAATQGSTGTVSAKLREMSASLGTINTSLGTLNTSVNASTTQLPADGTGQVTMANSFPVVLASDQSAIALHGHGATGAAVPANVTAMGARAGANSVNVAQGSATVAVNISTATTTQIVALSGSTQIYVTGITIVAGGTGNVTIVYGTGSACGTGTTSVSGAMPLVANSGFSIGSGLGPVIVLPAGQALCITTSAAVQMSGFVTYTQF